MADGRKLECECDRISTFCTWAGTEYLFAKIIFSWFVVGEKAVKFMG